MTPICKLTAALLLTATASAARADDRGALSDYVQARAAASDGEIGRAAQGFGAALAAAPDNELIAGQALGHAITAGDWRLALTSARILERRNAPLLDGRFLLLADAFKRRDWPAAAAQIDLIERDQIFAFAVPVLRAWLAQGSGQGDPLAALPAAGGQGLAAAYAAEHRPFLLALRNDPEAVDELIRAARSAGPRNARLRIAGAALLARRDRAGALRLLEAPGVTLAGARRAVEAGRPLPGAIDAPDDALGELLIRLALDLHAQELTTLAASFAVIATWLAPDNSETWLVAAELLGQQDRERVAVPLLANVRADDPFAAVARDQRIRLLLGANDREAALAIALDATRAPGAGGADWVRLGEVYAAMSRQREAADAFGRAVALRAGDDDMQAEWVLQLMRGGALDQAGDWPAAREALRTAYRLAPEQPVVLNYLGYAKLIRGEDVEEAVGLIRDAHRRAPDNAAITDSLGWALFLQGNLAEAIPLLERAAEGEPADVEINEHLGDAYLAAGRRVEARFAWAAALAYAEGEAATRIRTKIDTGNAARPRRAVIHEVAYAKLNLALHVRERLPDGYHRIETVFAFCEDGDALIGHESDRLTLDLTGPFARELAAESDNLVLRAAAALGARIAFSLDKKLPIASGLGGGSADAAAALRMIARMRGLAYEDVFPFAAGLGADVPACFFSQSARGGGRGDELEPLDEDLGGTPVLLVNPRRRLSTAAVFGGWDANDQGPLCDWRDGRNDLEAAAITLVPEIRDVLDALAGAGVARMSGSGATCFGLFDSEPERDRAAHQIAADHPNWWLSQTRLR